MAETIEQESICKHCWAHGDCAPGRTGGCCLAELYRLNKTVTADVVIQWCCVGHCDHSEKYHGARCPVKLAGINNKYPLNPRLYVKHDIGFIRNEPEFVEPETGQKRLSDFSS